MKLSEFDYEYPEELVAQRPLSERDASRMMVLDRAKKNFLHSSVKELHKFLNKGDLLVVNNTRVLPVRLMGEKKSGGKVEVLLLEETEKNIWKVITNRTKRLKTGEKILFDGNLIGEVIENGKDGVIVCLSVKRTCHCEQSEAIQRQSQDVHWIAASPRQARGPRNDTTDIRDIIEKIGLPPLPPYIKRKTKEDYTPEDKKRYQTIFAKHAGSAAAPTAGFHLSEQVIEECKSKGVELAEITLHVGLDTFSPVRVDDIKDHKMHGERFEVSLETVQKIEETKKRGGRVIAVGTTTVRALESFYKNTRIREHQHTTLFIRPGYEFKIVDAILTNFHQPKSTLLMMISAFAEREFIFQAYAEAIKEKYRLFSYGDCMLIM